MFNILFQFKLLTKNRNPCCSDYTNISVSEPGLLFKSDSMEMMNTSLMLQHVHCNVYYEMHIRQRSHFSLASFAAISVTNCSAHMVHRLAYSLPLKSALGQAISATPQQSQLFIRN